MYVKGLNFVKYKSISDGFEAITKVRYKHDGQMSVLKNIDNQMEVLFHKEVQGIAPGQSAVFYEGNDLLGGGFISKK